MKFIVLTIWLLSLLITTESQACQQYNNQQLELCYQMQDGNFIFINCTSTLCSQLNSTNNTNSNCPNQNITSYDQIQCLDQLCPDNTFNTLSTCINQLQGQNISDSKTLEIVFSVIGSVVGVTLILLLAYFVYRKFYAPKNQRNFYLPNTVLKPRSENTFIQSNLDATNTNLQIPSIQSNTDIANSIANKIHQKQANFTQNNPIIVQMGYINNQIINSPCCICLCSQQINCLTMCNHFYHAKCISQWMKKQQSCPQCRSKGFTPIKIFCSQCGKARDIFKFIHKRYACLSKIDVDFYTTSTLCHKCHLSHTPIGQKIMKAPQKEIIQNL